MATLPFKHSARLSLGVELEFQIVSPYTQNLVSRAKDLIRNIRASPYKELIKPEITQSMIEINSSIHSSPKELLAEFLELRAFLMEQAKEIGICICGGGTHPYQKWSFRKIFPTSRYRRLSKRFRYLSKRSTVFGQHIHIGCGSGDEAIYLTQALSRYVPQLVALSASSPFYESVDSGYDSSRSTIFNSFPLSGVMPFFSSWKQFTCYFQKMRKLSIVDSMKDFYWDIRPKPEFGTVEIRVLDTPLTIHKSILFAAYLQTLAGYLLEERPITLFPELYDLYTYNKFQAARYGFTGNFIDPVSLEQKTIFDDILIALDQIADYAAQLNNVDYLFQIKEMVLLKRNDAAILRELFARVGSLHNLVKEQCVIWGAD